MSTDENPSGASGNDDVVPASPNLSEPEQEAIKEGWIHDYISGIPVKATPEEVDAVQVFSRRLHEDYGYPKKHMGVTHSG